MKERKLFDAEYRFMCLVWQLEPVNSTKLAKMAEEELGWKKSTVYTVIKKLSEKGFLKNEQATVTSLIPKDEADRMESEELIQKAYQGSIKLFLSSFLKRESLSKEELEEIKQMIDEESEKR